MRLDTGFATTDTRESITSRSAAERRPAITGVEIESSEMHEGMLIWCYQVLLSRPPSAAEVVTLLPEYIETKDFNRVFAQILVTDEYANFK